MRFAVVALFIAGLIPRTEAFDWKLKGVQTKSQARQQLRSAVGSSDGSVRLGVRL